MGGAHLIDLAVRDAAAAGLIQAPRILASGRLVCMTGGHGWPIGREADGPEEVRRAAREQIKAGADLVKLMATGGVMTPGVEPGSAQLTEEELRAGVEEAHKAGRRAATHAQGTQGVLNALRAGIDTVEHGFFLDEECVELMVRHGVFFVPTLAALHNTEKAGLEAGVPEYMVDKARRTRSAQLESLALAKKAGVKIAAGTDASTPFNLHGKNGQELGLLVDNGFSPEEAVIAATSTAAACLGLEKDLGTVEEGKLADLIVVQGNPLDDIELLAEPENINLIIQDGKKFSG
jgi:imidazolonepropionase-like amidohydrolase